MIVLVRFRVPEPQVGAFVAQAQAAVEVLEQRDGFLTADVGRNVDEPDLFTVTTRWRNVGSYRRALGGYEAKMVVVPLLSLAIDEPSAYEEVVAGSTFDPVEGGPANSWRGSGELPIS